MTDKYMPGRIWIGVTFWAAALLTLAGCGLGGEPDIVATLAPVQVGHAIDSPVIQAGAAIFAERCTPCHGTGGAGDGELVTSGQVSSPGNFTRPEAAQAQSPLDWFTTITNGRIENLMPPWNEALSAEERWAVAMFTYTLSYRRESITTGQELAGASPALNAAVEALLADETALYTQSDDALAAQFAQAAPELNAAELRAVVEYTRTQSLGGLEALLPSVATTPQQAGTTTPEATPEPVPQVVGRITGTITNGTAGASVPDNITVTLIALDSSMNEQTWTTMALPDGTFAFEEVPIDPARSYFAAVTYHDRNYGSQPLAGNPASPDMEFDIVIYELTDDPSVISIIGAVIQIIPAGDTLQVLHVYRYRNGSDRLYSTSREVDEGRFESLTFNLPIGAALVAFDTQGRFIQRGTETYIDTRPLLPGDDNFVQLSYVLPYQRGAIIEFPVDYSMNGPFRLLMGSEQLTISSEQFQYRGPETIGSSVYQAYGGDLRLQAGDLVRFEISGETAPIGTSGDSSLVTSDRLVAAIFGALGLAFILAAGFLFLWGRARRSALGDAVLIDGLVRQIAELDAMHDAGQINHDVFQRRRAQLKTRLAELMDNQGEG